ncbi:MAG: Arginine-tRNA ligase [Candidatus Roizmanbacteria bacterium GW2011_GWA2_32_13]|uniref:Arginine--tRNA ligase n=1 Tax=Candidatus Roizmanbacteria bacterium GW2011_GWA2_32_13 TaxID=1618475 RepID=A0A0F9Z1N8_9BACT|nr:MAG: Arginine-tRNA ligase [Candidatus Roizmanbacteria bacterium GW2011_GWA2_32_13]
MKFKIEKTVFEKFPNLIVAVVIVKDFNNSKNREESVKILRNEEKKLRNKFNVESLLKNKYIIAYCEAFKKFGVDPDKFLPAHLALSRRVAEGFDLPDINSAVNIYNALSIKYLTPFGGENLETLYGDFVLKYAEGGEQWIPIGGKKSKDAVPGELIWRDDFDLSTRALNWRQCERTKLTDQSKNLFSIMDGFSDINKENIKIAAGEFINIIEKCLGGKGSVYWIDKNQPSVEIPFQSKNIKAYKKVAETPKIIKEKVYFGLAKKIDKNLKKTLNKIGIKNLNIDYIIEHPANSDFGDYSTNVALTLTKHLKKNPLLIAEEIKDNFPKTEFINKIDIIKPGFINFWISNDQLINRLDKIINNDFEFVTSYKNKKVMVEYTDPNLFKEFHIGHLYSNIVGESLSCIFESLGATVKRANYQGDVGMHVAKAMWGMKQNMKAEKINLQDLEKLNISEKSKFMGRSYALGTKEYEENKNSKKEIIELNKKIYDLDPSIKDFYEQARIWSLEYFENIYRRLDTHFDYYFFEREVGITGLNFVKENLKKGIFEKSEGAIVFNGKKDGLHTRVFINSLGLPTYEAKDLGLAPAKYKKFPYDLSIIVVGNEVKEYFKVVLKALEKINPLLRKKTMNVFTGMVNLPEGKMSSRLGNVVTVEKLLDELYEKAWQKIQETTKTKLEGEYAYYSKNSNVLPSKQSSTAEVVGVGAIKYALLKNGLGNNIEFNINESVNFDGNSGPYIQYTYVRCQSVLRKADNYLLHNC